MKQVTVIKNNFSILNAPSGTALVIGNFEGVHKGHQTLIQKLVQTAKVQNLTPCVYTFYPHPKKFFKRTMTPQRIMSLEQKVSKLSKLGVEAVIVKPFTQIFSNMSFLEFLQHLKNDLNIKHIIVGEDFSFGKGREGTVQKLKDHAATFGFTVEIIKDVKMENTERVSSSVVRQKLEKGQVKEAGLCLGSPVTLKTYLYEDDYCNLVSHINGYTPIKKGVYFAKVQYTHPLNGYDSVIVPVTIANNKVVIAPLAEMPDLVEGRVYLSLIDKIEK